MRARRRVRGSRIEKMSLRYANGRHKLSCTARRGRRNGKVQATFDLHGIKYTGSGYLGSAIAMDKEITKIMLRDSGIPCSRGHSS